MNPIKLWRHDRAEPEPLEPAACGKCGLVHQGWEWASQCCLCYKCKRTEVRRNSMCDACRDRQREDFRKQQDEKLVNAELVPDWDGWVFCDGKGPQEGYFGNVDELVEWLEDEEDKTQWPARVHICKTIPFPKVDPADIYECIGENSFEDVHEQLVGCKELEKAIGAFNDANVGLVSYEPDYERAVLVPTKSTAYVDRADES